MTCDSDVTWPVGLEIGGETNSILSNTPCARSVPRDIEYEKSEGVRAALSAIRSGAPVVFISGRAGSGKSRLIDYVRSSSAEGAPVVVAPTGIAAMSIDAATIHSAFRLPIGVIDADRLEPEVLSPVLRITQRIIIDEISMVRADLLDAVNRRLQQARNDPRPFGGVQLILVGDFLQLPPVINSEDRVLMNMIGYRTPFAFSAKVLRDVPLRVAALSKVWRQTDKKFISVLSDVREGKNTHQTIRWLNQNCVSTHRDAATPMLLTSTRSAAEFYNSQSFLEITKSSKSSEFVYRSLKFGVFAHDRSPLPAHDRLRLVPGLRVMSIRNDTAGRYMNGSLGTVLYCHGAGDLTDDHYVKVLFDGCEEPVRVHPARWFKSRQVWSEPTREIVSENVGEFVQIPLMHGYAITIHKSQGISLDDVRIDVGNGVFAPGQLYVGLSRSRSSEGLSLARPICEADVRVDEISVEFLSWIKSGVRIDFEKDSSCQ